MANVTTKGGARIFYEHWGRGQLIVIHRGRPAYVLRASALCCDECC